MEWGRAWYDGTLRPIDWIKVDEAIELRDPNSTKAGDTYCCQCKQTRISPVNAKTRKKHFRRHKKPPEGIELRSPCERIRKSQEQGETWKHTQIVGEIMHYLLSDDGKKIHSVSDVTETRGVHRGEADLIVTHSRKISQFESNEIRIVVRLWNWRRQRDLLKKYPNSIVIQAHRWQNSQITHDEFEGLVRKHVDEAYQMDADARHEFYNSSEHNAHIPNLRYWDFDIRGSNKQRKIVIPSNVQNEEIISELQSLESLGERIREHNLWAVSVEGMEQYHLKHLKYEDYHGNGLHPNSTIDAILSHAERFCDLAYDSIDIEAFRDMNRWPLKGVRKFWISPMNVLEIALAPGLWMWDELDASQRKKCLNNAKNCYRDQTYQKLPNGAKVPMVMNPLVNISDRNQPQTLHDENNIMNFISDYIPSEDLEIRPLNLDEFKKVQFYVSADKWITGLNPRHPIYESLLHDRTHYP